MRKLLGLGASTVLALACSSAAPAVTVVDSPDSWVDADAVAAAAPSAVAVAGYESSGSAVSPSVETAPAASPEWEVTEGHVTIVGYEAPQ